jgi:hypothetical protein
MVGEGMEPEGVVIIGPAQNVGNPLSWRPQPLRRIGQRQPILIIDPGRPPLVINMNMPSWHFQSLYSRPLPNPDRHDVMTAAGDGQPHLGQRRMIQPLEMLIHQPLHMAPKPQRLTAAGQVFPQRPGLYFF